MKLEDVKNEAEITNFEEARAATEGLIPEEEPLEPVEADPVETGPAEPVEPTEPTEPTEPIEPTEPELTEQPVNNEIQQVLARLQSIEQENAELRAAIQQQSAVQEEEIIEEALAPPELDLSSLMYADEETAKAKVQEYTDGLLSMAEKKIMGQIAPYLEQAKATAAEAEKAKVVEMLSQAADLPGFKEMLPRIESIMANNPVLKSAANLGDAYINAYAIARGVEAMDAPAEPTAEEILALIEKSPDVQKLYEEARLKRVEGSQQVPPLNASSGAANVALNIPEKPKTLEEARKRTEELFGA